MDQKIVYACLKGLRLFKFSHIGGERVGWRIATQPWASTYRLMYAGITHPACWVADTWGMTSNPELLVEREWADLPPELVDALTYELIDQVS